MALIFVCLGSLLYLFNYWRRLREDYSGNQIFGSAMIVFALLAVSLLVSGFINSEYWFLLFFLSTAVGIVIGAKRFKLKLFEVFDATISSWLIMGFCLVLSMNLFVFPKIEYLITQAGLIFLSAIFVFIDKRYANMSWYKSGKVGLSGLFTLAVFFLLKCILAAVFNDVVLFGQVRDIVFSGSTAFLLFLTIFIRARNLN